MATQKAECPVCGKFFSSQIISQHVNQCLGETDVEEEQKYSDRKRKQGGWDFLTKSQNQNPQKSAQKTPPAKKAKVSKSAKSDDKGAVNKKGKANSQSKKQIALSKSRSTVDDNEDENSNSSDIEFVCEEQEAPNKNQEEMNRPEDTLKHSRQTLETNAFKQATNPFSTQVTQPVSKSTSSKPKMINNKPLAEQVRPSSLEDYVGQSSVVGKKSLLHSILQQGDRIPSLILWGPPGCGKTTLAKIIANRCREESNTKFVLMSATSATVNDVKEAAKVARNDLKMFKRRTIVFLDEVHRFNKLQQDVLLPHVEDGTITLIGATTENPSFHVNGALLSRCRLVTLDKLQIDDIKTIIRKALSNLKVHELTEEDEHEHFHDGSDVEESSSENSPVAYIESSAINLLAGLVDGDARAALNGLELAVEGKVAGSQGDDKQRTIISRDEVKEGLQRSHILYDRTGEEHYNTISAMIKSMRGSDANAALYWMFRMLEGGENPIFIVRRMVIFASEDIGLADPNALTQAVATYHACHFIGMPECAYNLSQCVIYLSRAPKSVEVTKAMNKAKECVRKGTLPPVPLHLRNATTSVMKSLGYGKGYKYPPDYNYEEKQEYFPPELKGTDFFKN